MSTPAPALLGLSVVNKAAGFCIIKYADGVVQRVGIIDTKDAPDLSQRILGTLERTGPVGWIAMCDKAEDKTYAAKGQKDVSKLVALAKIQGSVEIDLKRTFPDATQQLLHLRDAARILKIKHSGNMLREAILEKATSMIPNFPLVRTKLGKVADTTYLMSEAWAISLAARRQWKVENRLQEEKLVSRLRETVGQSKEIRRLVDVAEKLAPQKAAQEIENVRNSRIDFLVRQHVERMVDKDEGIIT